VSLSDETPDCDVHHVLIRHLHTAGAQCAGPPDIVFPKGSGRSNDPLPPAGRPSENQSSLMPTIPACERLLPRLGTAVFVYLTIFRS
jgi:hypothetical protein